MVTPLPIKMSEVRIVVKELQRVFNYQARQVRTIVKDGEPWFVARDVCEIFGDTNYRRSVSRLDDDEKGVSQINTPGGPQEMTIVNEPGLYTLLFYMQPQKGNLPEEKIQERTAALKSFKRWVTHEVIPSIRKTGAYVAPASLEDLIILQAQSVKELKARVSQIEERTIAAHHRIDNLDNINIIGDKQQRLNAMVRKYAQQEGLTFSRAWRDFVQAYNAAYHTNLTMLKENHRLKKGMREISTPEYLAVVEKLDDALRVADKLLNQRRVAN